MKNLDDIIKALTKQGIEIDNNDDCYIAGNSAKKIRTGITTSTEDLKIIFKLCLENIDSLPTELKHKLSEILEK